MVANLNWTNGDIGIFKINIKEKTINCGTQHTVRRFTHVSDTIEICIKHGNLINVDIDIIHKKTTILKMWQNV